jgi:glycosyltransferase involved in cell wall biosynthesis
MADIVVCPGVFVMDSLPVWAKSKKLIISPFGSPAAAGTNNNQDAGAGDFFNRPLRILFVGSMGQRKGLGDLFEAMKILAGKDVELVVMGSLLDSMDFYRSEFKNFRYEPGRSHNQVLELMRSCDVFCLPSIVEGRALVMQEAMSQQLPIIITPNTGGADLVIEGQTGFLVPVKSPEKIAEKINWFLDNKGQIPLMGKMAQEHASKYTWEQYGHQVVNSIIDYLEQKNV